MDTVGSVLRRLTRGGDTFVSGQALAEELGVSRNAVWKAIQVLRERGCEIEAAPRRGYRLKWAPDVPDESAVLPGLFGTPFSRVVYLSETSSTNDVAKQQARAGAPEGTVVVADYQTCGRGRRSRGWVSPPGAGLAFSLVLRPSIHPRQTPLLVFLAAAAVRQAVAELVSRRDGGDTVDSEPVAIKWPNDVVVDGRKLCGVLVELNAELDRVHWCVIGVGLNVNQIQADFPPDLQEQATSVRIVTGRRARRVPLFQQILAGIAQRYDRALKHGFAELLAETRRFSATIGHDVGILEADGKKWYGRALDLAPDGALLVRPADRGHPVAVYAADVSVRPDRTAPTGIVSATSTRCDCGVPT